MSKQICAKSLAGGVSLKGMYKEAVTYLENIGFKKSPILSVTDIDQTTRIFFFNQGFEKVVLEYRQNPFEEVLKLIFKPSEIRFVHDILLMRFNQLAREQEDKVFIYNE